VASWALTDDLANASSSTALVQHPGPALAAAAAAEGGGSDVQGWQRMPKGKYSSGLTCLKAYRLAPQYKDIHGTDPASATFCNSIDPDWPLCSYEVRGSHLDPHCKHQHWADAALPLTGVAAQLQQMLTAASIHSPAVLVQNWKTAMQQAAAQRGRAQQLQQQKNASRLLLNTLAGQRVDWVPLIQQVQGAKAQHKAARVGADVRAGAAHMLVPAAAVLGSVLGTAGSSSSSISGGKGGQGDLVTKWQHHQQHQQQQQQQSELLATAGVEPMTIAQLRQQFLRGRADSQAEVAQGLSNNLGGLPLPWQEGPLADYGRPHAGLDLYNLPDGKQRSEWLLELQRQRTAAAAAAAAAARVGVMGTGPLLPQQQQHQQQGDVKEWRYYNPANWQQQPAAGDGGSAGSGAHSTAAAAVLGPHEATAAAIAQVDAAFRADLQQQQQQSEDWWLAWGLTLLGVLPGHTQQLLQGGTGALGPAPHPQQQQGAQLVFGELLSAANHRLLDGLNAHKSSQKIWMLQIHLLQLRGGFDSSQAAILERGESWGRRCYQFWLLSGLSRHLWQLQAVSWLKGLAGLTVAAPAGGLSAPGRTWTDAGSDLTTAESEKGAKGSPPPPAEAVANSALAGCVLDLALRLIRVLCEAGAEVLLQQLLSMLLGALTEAGAGQLPARHSPAQWKAANKACKSLLDRTTGAAAGGAAAAVWDAALEDVLRQNLGRFAIRGLLAVLLQHPVELSVLLVSAAHAGACGALPRAALARLMHQQGPVTIHPAEFGQLSGAKQGSGSQRLQQAGQLLKVAAQLLLEGPIMQRHTVRTSEQQQQQSAGVPCAPLTAARDSLACSLMRLQPYWESLGMSNPDAAGLGLRLLQAVPQKQSQLSRSLAGLLAAAGDVTQSASAAALILMLLLGQPEQPPTTPSASAVGAAAAAAGAGLIQGRVAAGDRSLLRMQAVMQATQMLAHVAFGAGLGGAGAAAAFCGLWMLPEHLAQHSAPFRHPEVFAGLSAAAAELDFVSLAAEMSSRGSRIMAVQLQQRLQQHILGTAASGLLYARAQQGYKQACAGVAGGAEVLQQAFAQGNGAVGAVWFLLRNQQQQRLQSIPGSSAVRQSYATLLDNLLRSGSGSNSRSAEGEQQQQRCVMQLCLALTNWAGYEASMGCWDMACQHVLDAVNEAHKQSTGSQVVALLEGCFLGIYSSSMGASGSAAAGSAAAGRRTAAGTTGAGQRASMLEVLLAALRPRHRAGSSSSSLAALQHPAVRYEHPGVRDKLSSPLLQLPHMLLSEGLIKVLQPLAPREVSCVFGMLVVQPGCGVRLGGGL
jgi:hypothetical protein